jgi:hypothetical protein
MEQILHSVELCIVTIDQILALASNNNLTSNGDLFVLLVTDWRQFLIFVIKYDRHASLSDTGLTLLVN